ncbi:hypothetical protein AVDCRST_MAG94-5667 [uncultured Leptolyngbya sp.]|uniref:Uncharacterized protein n=1 Tax=uncultured Leptolyngbya sp. TaxID=332963 RepID=A0A6J4NT35_9CYAN|nr:hypothetical protein AVDCRST_MAG94-5667 [uncultured Leptolyngbya sp.]
MDSFEAKVGSTEAIFSVFNACKPDVAVLLLLRGQLTRAIA